jgi:hypothetical protein
MATIAVDVLSRLLEADEYLRSLLTFEAVNTSITSPVLTVRAELMPVLREWAGDNLLAVHPSGSFAKGTAIRSGTDIDLLLSLCGPGRMTLREVHESLFDALVAAGHRPRRQNVSINIKQNGYSVDLVPGHQQNPATADHSLYVRKSDTWIKTNIQKHIAYVRGAKRADEIRVVKLWRNQHGLDFPSFYLEMVAIRVLAARATPYLAGNVSAVFEYLRDALMHARFVDPANSNNVLSDLLNDSEKREIAAAARSALATARWIDIVR